MLIIKKLGIAQPKKGENRPPEKTEIHLREYMKNRPREYLIFRVREYSSFRVRDYSDWRVEASVRNLSLLAKYSSISLFVSSVYLFISVNASAFSL